MSTPTQPMQPIQRRIEGPPAHAEIRRFVVAVERALDDLPADDVTELVGGLEADLTETWVAEGTTPGQRFGSPEAYAGELRAAAGLPARPLRVSERQGLLAATRSVARDVRSRLDRIPGWAGLADFARTLRPVWWVLRGYAGYLLLVQVATRSGAAGHGFPNQWPLQLALLALIVASVELGRRSLLSDNVFGRGLLVACNVVAILALVIIGTSAPRMAELYRTVYTDSGSDLVPGLSNDGYQVVNVFPYDRDGKPLTGVQLFDDRGRPLEIADTGRGYLSGVGTTYVDLLPGVDKEGLQHWNVFPLRERQAVDGNGTPVEDAKVRDAVRPDETQAPLLVADASDTAETKTTGEKK